MKNEREDTLHLEGQIDATNFGTICRYLYPTSPIQRIVFVDSDELLVQAAETLPVSRPGDAMLKLSAVQFKG